MIIETIQHLEKLFLFGANLAMTTSENFTVTLGLQLIQLVFNSTL